MTLLKNYLRGLLKNVNRTLKFINRSFDGKLNSINIDPTIEAKLKDLYITVGNDIDNGNTKDGLSKIFEFINYSNKYFDENEPWKLAKEDISKCGDILYNCCNIIFNINNLLKPYFIETTKKVDEYINSNISSWNYQKLEKVELSKEINPLFIRYDKKVIDEERDLLNNN